jgi:hypothetical protein
MRDLYTSIRSHVGHTGRHRGLLSGVSAVAVIALLSAVPAARAAVIHVVDVIPNSESSEAFQNSEPSLAVNPLNPSQMIAGTFGNGTPYFKSTNGGTIWSGYGNLRTSDKSIAWRQDGVAALNTTLQVLTPDPNFTSQILIRISGNFWTGVCLLSRATVR